MVIQVLNSYFVMLYFAFVADRSYLSLIKISLSNWQLLNYVAHGLRGRGKQWRGNVF